MSYYDASQNVTVETKAALICAVLEQANVDQQFIDDFYYFATSENIFDDAEDFAVYMKRAFEGRLDELM